MMAIAILKTWLTVSFLPLGPFVCRLLLGPTSDFAFFLFFFVHECKLIRSDEHQMPRQVQELHEESEQGWQGRLLQEMPV